MHIIPRKRARESPHIERFKRCTNTNGTQLWTALLAFFLAADNNIFLKEVEFQELMDYIENVSSNLGKTVVFDRIRMYGDTDRGKFYFTAHSRW